MGLKCQFKETDDGDGDEATREVKGRERERVRNDGLVLEKRGIMLQRRRKGLFGLHTSGDGRRRRRRRRLLRYCNNLAPSSSLLSLISKGAIVLSARCAALPPSMTEQEELYIAVKCRV